MKVLWCLIVLWKTALLCQANNRIVGGYEPIPHSAPFLARLDRLYTGDNFCGGSLINALWVVSAAHCHFDPVSNPAYVVLGDHDQNVYEGNEQEIMVILALNHPLYNPEITDNDVMMLKLESPAIINEFVQLAVLPDTDNYIGGGEECMACGWGVTDYVGSTIPSQLQCVEVLTETNEQCRSDYYGEVTRSMLCASSNAKDACNGDSGGPLTCNGILHGITSTGFGCGYPNFPGIYARVTEFVDWIDSIMAYF